MRLIPAFDRRCRGSHLPWLRPAGLDKGEGMENSLADAVLACQAAVAELRATKLPKYRSTDKRMEEYSNRRCTRRPENVRQRRLAAKKVIATHALAIAAYLEPSVDSSPLLGLDGSAAWPKGENEDDIVKGITMLLGKAQTRLLVERKQSRSRKSQQERGGQSGASDKIIAALALHHQYESGSCLNADPIDLNKLAKLAGVGSASASRFFSRQFPQGKGRSHDKYKALCRDSSKLTSWLRMLNREGLGSIQLGDHDKHIADD